MSWHSTVGIACSTLRAEEDPERAVRSTVALIRERHPELMDRPWTPVSEGLPTEPGWYEVTVRSPGGSREVHIGEWTPITRREPAAFVWTYLPAHFGVLAWRPAPEPWGGGS